MIGAAMAATALAFAGATGAVAPPEPRAVVWALGDGADGTPVAKRLARRIERDDPEAVLYLGDVYPSGSAEDYERNWEPVYGELAPIMWPTAGNHEWANRAVGHLPYWRQYGRAKPWYRLELGGWEVLNLNSQEPHEPDSPQLRWVGASCLERVRPAASPSGTVRASAPAPSTATPPTSPPSGVPCAGGHAWCSTGTIT